MLVHPSSGACDLFVELFRGLYCSVRIEVLELAYLQSNTTHEITQQIKSQVPEDGSTKIRNMFSIK
jgi:hypothetical protein